MKFRTIWWFALIGRLLTLPVSSYAQNHNPEFDVSDLHISVTDANGNVTEEYDYVIIPTHANATPERTNVTMKYRDGNIPTDGKTELSWQSGDKIDVYESGATDPLDLMTHKWEDLNQGEKDLELEAHIDATSGNSQVLQAEYTDTDNKTSPIGEREFTLLKVDLEASEFAAKPAFIGASGSNSIPLPDQLSEAREETEGIQLLVNNDDDDLNGEAVVAQITANDKLVNAENDSASLRINFPSIEMINSGTLSIELEKTTGEFGARLWKDRFDKSFTILVAAATQGIELSSSDSNASIGVWGSSMGSTLKSWDLSDAAEKADLVDIIQTRRILWLEGISTGEGKITLKLEFNGNVAFEDVVKVVVKDTKTRRMGVGRHTSVNESVIYRIYQESNEVIRSKDREGDLVVPTAFLPTIIGTTTSHETVSQNNLSLVFAAMDSLGYRVFVPSEITDAAGWADEPGTHIVIDSGDYGPETLAHELLHNFGRPHACIEHNILWGSGCEGVSPRGDGDTVTQLQLNLLD